MLGRSATDFVLASPPMGRDANHNSLFDEVRPETLDEDMTQKRCARGARAPQVSRRLSPHQKIDKQVRDCLLAVLPRRGKA
jgi:hypothetical protein